MAYRYDKERIKYRSELARERYVKRKKNKRINTALLIIIIAAAVIFLFAAVNIVIILINYAKARSTYDSIADEVIWISDENDESSTDDDPGQSSSIKFDFDLLKAKCEYAVGYIYQKDILSYPIVQYTDNSYYLTHLIDGSYSSNGTLFVDYSITGGLDAKNSIVYGHNMNDGSMFGSLKRYKDESYFEEYPEMDVFIGYKHYIYKVFSIFTADVDSIAYQKAFSSDLDFTNYLVYVKSQSIYDTGIEDYGIDSNIITLSTCTSYSSSRERFVVILIRDREITD